MKTATKQQTISSGNKPVAKFRAGGCEAAVWENEADDGKQTYSVTTKKSYHDGKEWKESKTLFANDIPDMVLVLQKAHEHIRLKTDDDEE